MCAMLGLCISVAEPCPRVFHASGAVLGIDILTSPVLEYRHARLAGSFSHLLHRAAPLGVGLCSSACPSPIWTSLSLYEFSVWGPDSVTEIPGGPWGLVVSQDDEQRSVSAQLIRVPTSTPDLPLCSWPQAHTPVQHHPCLCPYSYHS